MRKALQAIALAAQIDLLTEALLEGSGSNRSKTFAAILMQLAQRAERQRQADHEEAMARYPDLTPWCDDEEQVMGVWQNRLDVDTDSPEIPVGAERQYTYAPLDSILTLREVTVGPLVSRDPDPLVQGSDRTLPNDKQLVVLHDWEREEFLNARRPLGSAFQPGYDWQHGYRLDPRWVANESTLEREYGPMRQEKVAVVDSYTGEVLLDEQGQPYEEVVNRAGSVTWEYFRRTKEVPFRKNTPDDMRAGLPWIGTKERTPDVVRTADGYEGTVVRRWSNGWNIDVAVKIGEVEYTYSERWLTLVSEGRYVPTARSRRHFAWIMAQERSYVIRKARTAKQRENIIALARKIGRNPASPTFSAWVREVGYDIAEWKLVGAYAAKKQAAASA